MTQILANLQRSPLLWPLMAAGLIVAWSSGFVGIRYTNSEASVFLALFWRTLISGLILLPFALRYGPRMQARAVWGQARFGVMSVFLYLGGFAYAIELGVPTGVTALISDLLPLAIAALAAPLLGERMSARQWLGTCIAVAGVLVVSRDSFALGGGPLAGYLLTVGSMLVFALASVLHRRARAEAMPVHQSLCIHTLTGAVLFGGCASMQGSLMPPLTATFALGIGWMVLFATFAAYMLYYTALRLYPAAKVSAAIYLSPPVTMLWASWLFGEPFTATMALGLGITFIGVYLTSKQSGK